MAPSFLSTCSVEARELVQEPILLFPSTDTPPGNDLGWCGVEGATSSAITTVSRARRFSVFEDTGMIDDPGYEFGFDAEGNIVEHPTQGEREPAAPSATIPARKPGSDLATSAPERPERDAGRQSAEVCCLMSYTQSE